MSSKNRIMVIGLDAASLDIIEPMVEQGDLPNLAGVFKIGSRGKLTSTYPALTPPAWTTLLTGKNPGKHGVFDFYSKPYDPTAVSLTSYNSIQCATLWENLAHTDLKFGIVNYPFTYPPPDLNGFLISGIDTPNEEVSYSYPRDLVSELRSHGIDYRINLLGESSPKELDQLLEWMFQIEKVRKDAILYLIRNKPWDVFIGVFMLLDRVQHLFWHLHDSEYPSEQQGVNNLLDGVQKAYKLIDGFIGEILSALDENTYVVIASDHGFAKREQIFLTNAWLRKEKLLAVNEFNLFAFLRNPRFHEVQKPGSVILSRLGLSPLRKILPKSILERRYRFRVPLFKSPGEAVDWSKTKAYSSAYGIYINLKDRTPYGIVSPGREYDDIREQILKGLSEFPDPITGEKPILVGMKKEDVYNGPYVDIAPDVVFDFLKCKPVALHAYRFSRILVPKKRFGTHHQQGVLCLTGCGIKPNHRMINANIADVTATLFYLLGEAVPSDFDGKVLTDIFEENYVRNHPPTTRNPLEIDLIRGKADETYTPEESSTIADRLRNLGYLE
jgi:predicted AlkP superfamily phosphohydrolase/phosphomutase